MRIILADHHVQPCWALRTLLEEQPEFNLVGEAGDGENLLSLAKTHISDIILIDSELPGLHIEELITRLHALAPRPIVIVMSSEIENSRKMLRAGADAFVSKGDEPEWLLDILYKFEAQLIMGNGK
jgi:DNA-binding NarL/FixJ family response regulator